MVLTLLKSCKSQRMGLGWVEISRIHHLGVCSVAVGGALWKKVQSINVYFPFPDLLSLCHCFCPGPSRAASLRGGKCFPKRSVHKCQGKAIKILRVCSELMISELQEKSLNTPHSLIIVNFRCLARLRI